MTRRLATITLLAGTIAIAGCTSTTPDDAPSSNPTSSGTPDSAITPLPAETTISTPSGTLADAATEFRTLLAPLIDTANTSGATSREAKTAALTIALEEAGYTLAANPDDPQTSQTRAYWEYQGYMYIAQPNPAGACLARLAITEQPITLETTDLRCLSSDQLQPDPDTKPSDQQTIEDVAAAVATAISNNAVAQINAAPGTSVDDAMSVAATDLNVTTITTDTPTSTLEPGSGTMAISAENSKYRFRLGMSGPDGNQECRITVTFTGTEYTLGKATCDAPTPAAGP